MSKYDWSEIGQRAPPYMIRMVLFAQFQKNSTVTTVLILKKSFNHDQNFVLLSNGNFEREVRSLVLITGTGDAGTSQHQHNDKHNASILYKHEHTRSLCCCEEDGRSITISIRRMQGFYIFQFTAYAYVKTVLTSACMLMLMLMVTSSIRIRLNLLSSRQAFRLVLSSQKKERNQTIECYLELCSLVVQVLLMLLYVICAYCVDTERFLR